MDVIFGVGLRPVAVGLGVFFGGLVGLGVVVLVGALVGILVGVALMLKGVRDG